MAAKLHEEKVIFFRAIEIVSAEDRAAYLDEACGDDDELRAQVDALIRQHEKPQRLLDAAQTRQKTERFDSVDVDGNDSADSEGDQTQALDEIPLDFLEPTDHPGSLGRLDQYEVLEVVGRGGMGIVLKAQDTKLNRVVAVKVLAPELASNPTARKRFLREAQAAAAVSHDHVVTIYAVEDGNAGPPYLVMEFIDGQSLQEKLDHDGQLELKEILRIGRQIAAGLAAAHEQGLIHRDVKPSNILLQNGVQRVQITDFGLARAVDDVGMTKTGEVTGTPQYMSPEQAQGHPVDARSDLFSLGSVLYTMCTGRSPFRADTSVASLRRVCDDTPRPIREVNPDIPDWLVAIIDRLLEKNADDRIQTATEVAELLGKHLAHLQDPGSTPFPGTVRPLKCHSATGGRRQWWLVASLVLLAVATSFGVTEGTGVTQVTQSVISIVRGNGTLIVEVDDPAISITIEGDDLVITGAGPQEVRLKPGSYRLSAVRDGTPVPLERELVTIARGGRQVVRITLENSSARATNRITEIRRFSRHDGSVLGLAFTPDGDKIISASGDRSAIFWDVESGHVIDSWSDYERPISAMAISPDGEWLAVCEFSGRITLHNLADGRERSWIGHEKPIANSGAVFASESLVTASHDGTAHQWDLESGEEIRSLSDPGRRMTGAATTADGQYALITGQNERAWLWNLQNGNVELRLDPAPEGWSAAILPGSRQAVIGHLDGVVRLWDLATGHVVQQIPAHSTAVSSIAVTRDGRHCISSGWDKTLKISELESGRKVAEIVSDTHCVRRFCLSPDGRQLLSAGGDYHDLTIDMWTTDGDYDIRLWQLPERVWPRQTPPWSANTAQTIADNVYDASDDFDRAAAIGHRGLTQCPDVPWFDASIEPLYLALVTNDEIYERVLRLASTHQTPRAELLDARGSCLAREKRFQEARTSYEQRLALGQARAGVWHAYALVLLALHDDDSYRQLCDRISIQFKYSESFPLEATYSCWTLVLAPHEIQDPDGMLRLADSGVRFIPDPIDPVLGHGVHGACLYRIGRYEEAIRSLETCAAADESPGHSALGLSFLPFLAMAHHELGHDEDAAAWRDRVHEWNENSAEGADWYHTVILDRLIEEMETVMKSR